MKKLKIGLIFVIILAIFIAIFPTDSFAYVSVKGYFRSDGTYVRPHVRSDPNAFKFDNYSWTPSQGLYNPSYYAPTKNYSSNWYIPSYITNSDYYLGKSLYESGQSGLGLYTTLTTQKLLTPSNVVCVANAYVGYDNKCYCNSGYKVVNGQCEKVVCVANAYVGYDNKCYCNSGYKVVNGQCEKL